MSYNLRNTNTFLGDAFAPAPAPTTNQPESSAQVANPRRGNNTPGNNFAESAANNPNPAVTISVADLQAIKQRIADLEEASQRNPRRRRWSECEPDYERVPKRSNHTVKPLTNTVEKIIRS